MDLTYDTRRHLKVQVDQARRVALGVCETCGTFHQRRDRCARINLEGYPSKVRWQADEVVGFLRRAKAVLGKWPTRGEYDNLRGGRRGGDPRMPNSDCAVRRWGTWEAAIEVAKRSR